METAQRRQTISKLSRIPGYAGGGFLDKLKGVFGGGSTPPPPPPPKEPPPEQPPASIWTRTNKRREQEAGAANGSKVKPGMAKAAMTGQGGMLKGPGTSTSDDIPAKVVDTDEPIRVATGERIVSKSQDKFLQQVAKERGFGSVDAMFEDATGIPVGPTLKYAKGEEGEELMEHAGLGAMLDSAKRAVGLAPAETVNERYARQDAEYAARQKAKEAAQPKAQPASAPTGARAGLDGSGGNSMSRREKEAGLAGGGSLSRNMALKSMGSYAGGGIMGEIPAQKKMGVNAPVLPTGQTDEDRERAMAETMAAQTKREQVAETRRREAREDMHRAEDAALMAKPRRRGARGYAGGGIMGVIEANPKGSFGGIPKSGPTLGTSSYASGGLMGEIEKKVSSYIQGTPSYSGGGLMGVIEAQKNLGWKGVDSFEGGGKPDSARKKKDDELAMAIEAKRQALVAQIPTGGVPGAGPTAPPPAAPGAFDDTKSIAKAAMADVGSAIQSGNVGRAINNGVRGLAATQVSGVVDAGGLAARALRPVGNFASNLATGEDMAPPPAPTAPAAQPVVAAPPVQPAVESAPVVASPQQQAGQASAMSQAAMTAKAERDALTQRDIAMGDRMQADREAAAEANYAQGQRQQAVEQQIGDKIDRERALWNAQAAMSSITNTPEQKAAASQQLAALTGQQTQAQNNDSAMQRLTMTDQSTRRGQDMLARTANAQTQVQRDRFGLEQGQATRADKKAAREERAQQRIESLYDDYANADAKDKPALAEQLRVLTGKDKPEQWQAIALQGSTDAMGNKTEGVLAAVNKSTGEMRKLDQGGSGGASNAPITKADYDKLPKGAKYTHPDGSTRTKG